MKDCHAKCFVATLRRGEGKKINIKPDSWLYHFQTNFKGFIKIFSFQGDDTHFQNECQPKGDFQRLSFHYLLIKHWTKTNKNCSIIKQCLKTNIGSICRIKNAMTLSRGFDFLPVLRYGFTTQFQQFQNSQFINNLNNCSPMLQQYNYYTIEKQ